MKSEIKTSFGKTKILRSEAPGNSEKLLIVPGYSEGVKHADKLLGALASRGFDSTTFSQPRKRGAKRLDPIDRQSSVLLDVLNSQTNEHEKVHAVAHSLGGAAVLRAAQAEPDRFSSIIIMMPAGVAGEQGFGELLKRVSKKLIQNRKGAKPDQDSSNYYKDGHYQASVDDESSKQFGKRIKRAERAAGATLLKNVILSISEANAAGKYDLTDDVRKVSELGIPIHIVTALDDEMFDADVAHANIKPLIEDVQSYSSVADPGARHDTSWMQPERTAAIIDQIVHPTA